METLAYLHLALAYETSADIGLCERRLDGRRFSTNAGMYLLPLIVTLSVLGMASATLAQTFRLGDSGPEITVIQERLQKLGYLNQSPTGNFGSVTRDAVIQFQQEKGLPPDGIVGPETIAELFSPVRQARFETYQLPPLRSDVVRQTFSPTSRTNVLQRGDRGSEVRQLQERLKVQGFDPGLIDGIYGSQTENAVRQFQQANRLFPDGVADSATLAALRIGGSQQNPYVVVVPVSNDNTLSAVRAVPGFENADLASSRQGSYVNAGSFPNRASAESRSYLLRSRGFDARVAYFR